MKRKLSFFMILILIFLSACNGDGYIKSDDSDLQTVLEDNAASALNEFSVFLLKQYDFTKNDGVLISPISIVSVLGMMANGAENDTLKEIENIIGLNRDEINALCRQIISDWSDSNECDVRIASSIWYRGKPDFEINKDFLKKNKTYYDSSSYKTHFDDKALEKINQWIYKNSGNMIEDAISDIADDSNICLISASSFDAEWDNIYQEWNIEKNTFYNGNGSEKYLDYMYSGESIYLQSNNAEGFLKPYKGSRYAFMGILPDENISLNEFLNSWSGSQFTETLSNAAKAEVSVSIPKFETESSLELVDILQKAGLISAFSPDDADFSSMGTCKTGNCFIGEIINKTIIKVDERGTKAGAVASVIMPGGSPPVLHVRLTRPFIYGIIDLKYNVPLFLGTVVNF